MESDSPDFRVRIRNILEREQVRCEKLVDSP